MDKDTKKDKKEGEPEEDALEEQKEATQPQKEEKVIIMKKGDYCITFPEDAHKPSCGHGNHLTKICVKIPS